MRELITRGVPLVFVSHNLPAVAELCTRALLITRGKMLYQGPAAETVQHYRRVVAALGPAQTKPDSDIWITGVQLLDQGNTGSELFRSGAPMTIRIQYQTRCPVQQPGFGVDVHKDGIYCFGINTRIDGHDLGVVSGRGHVDLEIDALQLASGCYTASVAIHRAGGIGSGGGIGCYDLHELAYPFTVTSDRDGLGLIALPHAWRHQAGEREDVHASNVHKFSKGGTVRTVPTAKEVAVR
jgi:hypothetical protein